MSIANTPPETRNTAGHRAAVSFPRSMLFVSGEKPERFDKAMAAGADVVCIDLEDAVAHTLKEEARRAVLKWLSARPARAAGTGPEVALRINAVRTLHGLRDILALAAAADVRLDWLLVPKTECETEIACIDAWLGEARMPTVALIETPLGIERAARIAGAGGSLAALMLGGADLSAELDAQFGWAGLAHARGRLVNAAKSCALQAWDVPHIELDNAEGLAEETRAVIALGFNCKTAIHPRQIATIHDAFVPPAEQVEWARALLAAPEAAKAGGAFLFRGRMVDAPVLRKARRIASLAAASSSTTPRT
ncbi:MAG: CoA ester lyase [Gammaproteobacteria bacterium]|nr:CoA ester lyase [Gammaproteobacteria bacterium]